MTGKSEKLMSLLGDQPVIPVLKVKNATSAVPLARALAKGGLRLIEITLRTPEALEAIRRVAGEVEGAVVGAGTVLNPKQFDEAAKAGSKFIVSPGLTGSLISAAAGSDVPSEVLPRRTGGRHDLPALASLAAGGRALLPDRRHLGAQRRGVPRGAECRVRWRLVGGAR